MELKSVPALLKQDWEFLVVIQHGKELEQLFLLRLVTIQEDTAWAMVKHSWIAKHSYGNWKGTEPVIINKIPVQLLRDYRRPLIICPSKRLPHKGRSEINVVARQLSKSRIPRVEDNLSDFECSLAHFTWLKSPSINQGIPESNAKWREKPALFREYLTRMLIGVPL